MLNLEGRGRTQFWYIKLLTQYLWEGRRDRLYLGRYVRFVLGLVTIQLPVFFSRFFSSIY
jgi:hypothetical protein